MSKEPISVREEWTLSDLLAAGWSEADLEWERLAEQAMLQLGQGLTQEASKNIGAGLYLARTEFAKGDPRLAASLGNQAACLASEGKLGPSPTIISACLQAWADCDGWIETMTAPRSARSSMFHLRMERLHRDAYQERWRHKGRDLLISAKAQIGTGQSIALINAETATIRSAQWDRERPFSLSDPRKLIAATSLTCVQNAD